MRRHSSYADANFAKLLQIPKIDHRLGNLRFARDYSFRELKADNAVLLGNSRANSWIEPFEGKLGLRWIYDVTEQSGSRLDPRITVAPPTMRQKVR